MIPQYLCRRQCLILLIVIGSLLSLYIIIINKFSGSNTNTNTQIIDGLELNTDNTDDPAENKRIQEYQKKRNNEFEIRTDIHIAQVVNGPLSIRRVVGTLDGVGCKMNDINPFSKEIMKYMHDFGDHKCTPSKDAEISVLLNTIQVVGTGVDFVRYRKIVDNITGGFDFGDYVYFIQPTKVSPMLSKGKSGSIRNDASKRCILPGTYNPSPPAAQIEVIYSLKCDHEQAEFSFNSDGTIVHKFTKKCLGPKDGLENPAQNTQLVLSDHCKAKFDVINEGVLQMKGAGLCVHPLWGGDSPEEGQKLCLYPECETQKRLTYRWHLKFTGDEKKVTNEQFTMTNDMNHVQVQLLNENIVNTYALSVVPKPIRRTESVTPNIFIISIEEASAPHFKRKLPLTYKVMKKMGFVEYKYHSALSPLSNVNFMTMLNGHSSSEGNAKGSIIQLAKKYNHVTLFSADDPINVPVGEGVDVDHDASPLFRTLKQRFNIVAQSYCVSGQPIYDVTFNYLSSFINSYPLHTKLAIVLLSEISRVNFNYLGYMDKHFTSLLDQLSSLKNTIIFIQTLKGGESGKLSQLVQGVEEIKRPLFSAYASNDIRDKYNFETSRTNQLSTSYDTYVTLRHIITQEKQKHDYGRSFLKKSKSRNCLQAAVYPSMCPCV